MIIAQVCLRLATIYQDGAAMFGRRPGRSAKTVLLFTFLLLISLFTHITLANVQSLENKMDDLRARISFQRDIRDCNIICLTETWLTPSVPDTAVTPSDNFSVLRMDRTAEAGKYKGGGVCFMTNKKWCDPRNISSLS